MSNTKCNCKNPDSGGTKCPSQHIAICFRGKDNECYGECIPIGGQFRYISEEFSDWAEFSIKEKVVDHIMEFRNQYKTYGNKDDISYKLKTDFSLNKDDSTGRLKCYFIGGFNIVVSFSFSFVDDINPNDQQRFATY